MLKIDRLRISLPAGYEARADRIARLVADELAALPIQGDANLDRLSLPTVEVARNASNRRIASSIASSMAAQLGGKT